MRTMTTLSIALALALAGACKKDKNENKETPPQTGSNTAGQGTGMGKVAEPPKTLTGADLANKYIECSKLMSAGDAKFKDCLAPDAVSKMPDSGMPDTVGADKIWASMQEMRTSFTDMKGAPQLLLVNGRQIAAVLWHGGTHTGAMKMGPQEIPATNKKFGALAFQLLTFNDANQATEEIFIMDMNTWMNQLGLSPQPGRPLMESGKPAPDIAVAADDAKEKANLELVKKSMDNFNKNPMDFKAAMADYADDAVESDLSSPKDAVGKAEIEKGMKMFKGAFPDGKVDIQKSWAAGDYVVLLGEFTGTNTGAMDKMKPTGKPVKLTIAEIGKIENGKIKQWWRFYNSVAFAQQLGLMPEPGKEPGKDPGKAGDMNKEPAKDDAKEPAKKDG
jgi:predicted ester cyclase